MNGLERRDAWPLISFLLLKRTPEPLILIQISSFKSANDTYNYYRVVLCMI